MPDIYTTVTAAAELGCSARTVQRLAQLRCLGITIRGALALTPAEVEQLRPLVRGPGNPQFSAGNQEWTKRKSRNQTVQSGDNRLSGRGKKKAAKRASRAVKGGSAAKKGASGAKK